MSVDLASVLQAVEKILALEKQIETAIASEKDAKRRERLAKACKDRDLEGIREILFSVD